MMRREEGGETRCEIQEGIEYRDDGSGTKRIHCKLVNLVTEERRYARGGKIRGGEGRREGIGVMR